MNRTSVIRAAAFFVAFFVVGIPYWQLAYQDAQLPSVLLGLPLLAVVIAAFAVRRFAGAGFLEATSLAGAAVPCAVMVRVLVETSSDATTHNLWPIEAVLGIGVGLIASAAGALIGTWPRPST